tara:strand:+ start:798 stop:1031 length:234 start_codon:yes stop_codon:yes gene_type:complete
MKNKINNLQESYLNQLRKEKVPVSVYLVSGIKLQGEIESFDQFSILLKSSVSQMVYKHAISTIQPARNISLSDMYEE